MQRPYPVSVFVLAALVAIPGCGRRKTPVMGEVEPGKFVLLYSFEQGDEFEMVKTRKERSVRTIMGSETETRTEKSMSYGFTVESAGPEGFGIACRYEDRTYEIESQDPRTPPDFSGLIGKGVAFTLSGIGHVSDLRGFESLPEIYIPEQEFYVGIDQYTNEIQDIFYRLPDKPVVEGDTWSATETFRESFPMGNIEILVNERYKLTGKTKKRGFDCVSISNTYTVAVAGRVDAGGMKFALAMEGGGTDEIHFAYEEGMFVRAEGQWRMEGAASNAEMGISIPMEGYYQTSVEVEVD